MTVDKTLYRASFELQPATGRTITGLAVPWDRPTKVRDLTGPPYVEAFAPGSADVTIRQHDSFPIFVRHDYMTDPLGVVTFQRSAEGLLFDGTMSKTTRADEMLELINDRAMRSVSVGFRPIQAVRRRFTEGETVYRTEVALRELSLAPTGFGQYAEAGILSVRDSLMAGQTFDAVTDAVRDAIAASIGTDETGDGPCVYVRDIADSWCVYEVEGGPLDVANAKQTLYKVDYSQDADGAITLSDPIAVAVSYVPTGRAELGHDDLRQRARRAADAMRLRTLA